MTKQWLSIREAKAYLNVSRATLDRWQKKGLLCPHYTPGGHRRFLEADLRHLIGVEDSEAGSSENRVVIYARVSTHKQAEAGTLRRQEERLVTYAVDKGYAIVARFQDVASGLNEQRPGLHKALEALRNGQGNILLIEYRDRLARFGYQYLESVVQHSAARIEVLESPSIGNPQQELVDDLIAIVTRFSARLYGKRGGRLARQVEHLLKEALPGDAS
jgi:excisionase family DNA binding protein